MRNTNTNNVGGISGLAASAVTAAALSGGDSHQTEYLQKTLPNQMANMNAWQRIWQFRAWVIGGFTLAGIDYALYKGLENQSLPTFLGEISFIWVPLMFFMVPFFYLITGIPLSMSYMNSKMRARFFDPGTAAWNAAGQHPGGAAGLFSWFMRALFYVPILLPLFIMQDIVELLRTVATGGKHKFHTSKGHYFEKQKRQYRYLVEHQSTYRAEEFLRDSTMAMYFPATAKMPTMSEWLKGRYRAAIIPAMERRYGPLLPKSAPRPMPKEKHIVDHSFDKVKVKRIKL